MKENLSKNKFIFHKYSDVILRSNEVAEWWFNSLKYVEVRNGVELRYFINYGDLVTEF